MIACACRFCNWNMSLQAGSPAPAARNAPSGEAMQRLPEDDARRIAELQAQLVAEKAAVDALAAKVELLEREAKRVHPTPAEAARQLDLHAAVAEAAIAVSAVRTSAGAPALAGTALFEATAQPACAIAAAPAAERTAAPLAIARSFTATGLAARDERAAAADVGGVRREGDDAGAVHRTPYSQPALVGVEASRYALLWASYEKMATQQQAEAAKRRSNEEQLQEQMHQLKVHMQAAAAAHDDEVARAREHRNALASVPDSLQALSTQFASLEATFASLAVAPPRESVQAAAPVSLPPRSPRAPSPRAAAPRAAGVTQATQTTPVGPTLAELSAPAPAAAYASPRQAEKGMPGACAQAAACQADCSAPQGTAQPARTSAAGAQLDAGDVADAAMMSPAQPAGPSSSAACDIADAHAGATTHLALPPLGAVSGWRGRLEDLPSPAPRVDLPGRAPLRKLRHNRRDNMHAKPYEVRRPCHCWRPIL